MRKAGIPVGIAADGPMSGNTLDLFSQFALVFRSAGPQPQAQIRAGRP